MKTFKLVLVSLMLSLFVGSVYAQVNDQNQNNYKKHNYNKSDTNRSHMKRPMKKRDTTRTRNYDYNRSNRGTDTTRMR